MRQFPPIILPEHETIIHAQFSFLYVPIGI